MRAAAETKRQRWAILAVAIIVLAVSLAMQSAYYQLVLTQVLLWAVLSLAWNILCGYSGYFSFGHAAFWGLGAYTVALGMIYLDLPPWVGIPLGAIIGGMAGAVIGYPTFRCAVTILRLRCSPTRWRRSTSFSGWGIRRYHCR
jgi:ABC-type branched-subunit amino acid transport system permease subunit